MNTCFDANLNTTNHQRNSETSSEMEITIDPFIFLHFLWWLSWTQEVQIRTPELDTNYQGIISRRSSWFESSQIIWKTVEILQMFLLLLVDELVQEKSTLLERRFSCQVLEELVIEETTREKPRVIDISIYTLKSFSFSYRFVIDISVDCPYKFVINAPNLVYFRVKGRISDDFVVKSLGTLMNAHLDLRQTAVLSDNYIVCQQRVFNLFKGIANVKFLSLSNDIVQLLCSSYDLNLPRFFNLTTVGVGIGVDICWKKLVTQFIKCSPNMVVLALNNKQGLWVSLADESCKSPPRPVPEYLLVQLKGILIQELYSNFLPEAVENLLQDVNVLKRLKITCQCPVMLRSQIGHAF